MKTAQEILNKHIAIDTDSGYKIGLNDTIINAMNEYAKEVAKEALKNASENFLGASDFARDTRQSILNESNIPEL